MIYAVTALLPIDLSLTKTAEYGYAKSVEQGNNSRYPLSVIRYPSSRVRLDTLNLSQCVMLSILASPNNLQDRPSDYCDSRIIVFHFSLWSAHNLLFFV